MKSKLFLIELIFISLSLAQSSFSQDNCNAGFEEGTTAGWICKSGYHGVGCPSANDLINNCYSFQTILPPANNGICINDSGIDAPLGRGTNRHTIMNHNAYGGTGIDPNSIAPYLIPVVDSGGGNYSFRLGDSPGGIVVIGNNSYARTEAIRFTFNVTSQNSIFTYSFAVFIQDPADPPEEHPLFEAMMFNSLDSLLTGTYNRIIGPSSDSHCNPTLNFHRGVGAWVYSDWTSVTTDLSSFIGQFISIEFRTSNAYECTGSNCTGSYVTINGACTTTCRNGVCCTSTNCGGGCSGSVSCSDYSGDASDAIYAYIDASCSSANGIKEINNSNSIRIYPNPITASSIIEISEKNNAEVVIYDILGKEMLRKFFSGSRMEIKKGSLESGVYFVRVMEGERQWVEKMVVE